MNHIDREKEAVSSLMDGEADHAELDALIRQLEQSGLKDEWDLYHQIGDALRSDDLNMPMSSSFNEKFAERFASEPVILSAPLPAEKPQGSSERKFAPYKWGFAGAIAAGLMAFVLMPQIAGTGKVPAHPAEMVAAKSGFQLASAKPEVRSAQASASDEVAVVKPNQLDMLRDPRIDSYLVAHQRFSPTISKAAVVTQPAQEK